MSSWTQDAEERLRAEMASTCLVRDPGFRDHVGPERVRALALLDSGAARKGPQGRGKRTGTSAAGADA